MKALIDGDILVYNCGFAGNKKKYRVAGIDFDKKKEAVSFCEDTDIPVEEILVIETVDPLEFTLHSVKLQIQSILRATKADDYTIYLSGKDNFREKLAFTRKYKGNRDPSHKPAQYNEIKQYLIDTWQAVVVNGMEADDAMGIEQYRGHCSEEPDTDCVICTLDKDLNMIPGMHYNWRKADMYYVDDEQARYNFYKQLLTGDPVDNIQGVPKIGEKTAEKLLKGKTAEEMAEICQEQYYMGYYKHGNFPDIDTFLDTIDDTFMEHAQLIWIKQSPDEDLPKELLEILL